MRNASNGNTGVLINNREITKAELKMLQVSVLERDVSFQASRGLFQKRDEKVFQIFFASCSLEIVENIL